LLRYLALADLKHLEPASSSTAHRDGPSQATLAR
jgi:hypothetical protein